MTPVTQTAAAAKVTMLTRRRFCWMSLWKGQLMRHMLTVQLRLLAPCSGLWETPPAKGHREALPPAPQHQPVSKCPPASAVLILNLNCLRTNISPPPSTASSTGLIYIDPTNLRRSSAISSSAAAAAAALEASNSSSYLTSASSLARAYSIVIRQISDLMSLIPKYNHLVYSQYPAAVKLTYQDAVNLQV